MKKNIISIVVFTLLIVLSVGTIIPFVNETIYFLSNRHGVSHIPIEICLAFEIVCILIIVISIVFIILNAIWISKKRKKH